MDRLTDDEETSDSTGDGDLIFNVCPDAFGMRVEPFGDPRMAPAIELRSGGSFDLEQNTVGRMHIEMQDCHVFDGTWRVPESAEPVRSRPRHGDWVSAAGDWVVDDGHDGWSELHEARALAVVHGVAPGLHYVALNVFFNKQSRQADRVHVDVRIPRSDPALKHLSCERVDDRTSGCPLAPGVTFKRLDSAVDDGGGFCIVELERGDAKADPFACHPTEGCDGKRFRDVGCSRIAFAGLLRARWTP